LEALGIEFLNHAQPGVRLIVPSDPVRPSKRTVSAKAVRGKTAEASGKKR
jgi:hypothetical protein